MASGQSGSCVVEGLSNGTSYTFRATASNADGSSLPSASSPPVIPQVPAPQTPPAPRAVAGVSSATVTPLQGGGGTPLSFTVSATAGGAGCTVTGSSGSCVVRDLVNGTAYAFTATASNAGGTSSASAASVSVVPRPASNVFRAKRARTKVSKSSITLITRVTVSGAGRISQVAYTRNGRKLTARCTGHSRATTASTRLVACKIGKSGRLALRKSNLRLSLRTTFSPVGGKPAEQTQTVKLRMSR